MCTFDWVFDKQELVPETKKRVPEDNLRTNIGTHNSLFEKLKILIKIRLFSVLLGGSREITEHFI